MSRSGAFSAALAKTIGAIKYFYLRAGDDHRFTPVWVVVVEGRVLVRPWNDRPTGWYRGFLNDRRGAVRVGDREVPVRARRATSAKLHDAMDSAYAAKYTTPANRNYVAGFATAGRRATSLELLPR